MYYFLNQYIKALNSSVEHAEFHRLALFKHERLTTKIVTRDFDPMEHLNAANFGLAQDDILNMYDYFQDTVKVKENSTSVKKLNIPISYQLKYDSNVSKAYQGGRLAQTIHHTPGRVGEVASVEHYDEFGNIANRELWDSRGFHTASQLLDYDGAPHAEILYHLDGTRAVERFWEITDDRKGKVIFSIHLINYKGNDYYFNSEDDLFTFFLDEINRQTKTEDTFIADRPGITDIPLVNMKTRAKKYLFFPILHAANPEDLINSELEPSYAEVFKHLDKLDGLITMTEDQARQLRIRLKRLKGKGRNIKITAIPGVAFSNQELKKPQILMNSRPGKKVLYAGRLGVDKGVDNLIRAFALVTPQVPDATLDIRGFGDQDFVQSLENLIKQLNLQDNVTISGYTSNIEPVYDSAKIFASAAHQDAFPLAMAEALAHGLPLVAFDTNFGPSRIIKDGVNGYLLAPGDLYGYAQDIISLLTNDKMLQRMSVNSYESAKDYEFKNVWKQWRNALNLKSKRKASTK
ncbi:glycosyltransferase [Lentilactobacillus raoultii]|uniref:Glycosyltransferase n=1 Tax=Lentilactobacillus raoultii TaxID=1987503 RepID=A0ABW3PGE8_9LACO|nr:glycosyltransferase [Lentilactobacillus raoultii]